MKVPGTHTRVTCAVFSLTLQFHTGFATDPFQIWRILLNILSLDYSESCRISCCYEPHTIPSAALCCITLAGLVHSATWVPSVEPSAMLCWAAEWETTRLSTQCHVAQRPHKQTNSKKHGRHREKWEAHQRALTCTKQKCLRVYCPRGSLSLAFHQYEAQQFLFRHEFPSVSGRNKTAQLL